MKNDWTIIVGDAICYKLQPFYNRPPPISLRRLKTPFSSNAELPLLLRCVAEPFIYLLIHPFFFTTNNEQRRPHTQLHFFCT